MLGPPRAGAHLIPAVGVGVGGGAPAPGPRARVTVRSLHTRQHVQLRPLPVQQCPARQAARLAWQAAASLAPIWPRAADFPGPEEVMAEQEASGLQVLLRTLQVGRGGELQNPAGWVFVGRACLGAGLSPQSPLAPVAWFAKQQ